MIDTDFFERLIIRVRRFVELHTYDMCDNTNCEKCEESETLYGNILSQLDKLEKSLIREDMED